MRLVWALAPLVAFYVVEAQWGLRAGVLAAMALGIADLAVGWLRDGRLNRLTLIATAMVVGLGGLSLASDDERFVLWTPVAGDLLFAVLLVGGLALPESWLEIAAREQDPTLELDDDARALLRGLTVRFSLLLVAHAGATAWATTASRETWLFVSGPLQFVMIGALAGFEVLRARR